MKKLLVLASLLACGCSDSQYKENHETKIVLTVENIDDKSDMDISIKYRPGDKNPLQAEINGEQFEPPAPQ